MIFLLITWACIFWLFMTKIKGLWHREKEGKPLFHTFYAIIKQKVSLCFFKTKNILMLRKNQIFTLCLSYISDQDCSMFCENSLSLDILSDHKRVHCIFLSSAASFDPLNILLQFMHWRSSSYTFNILSHLFTMKRQHHLLFIDS